MYSLPSLTEPKNAFTFPAHCKCCCIVPTAAIGRSQRSAGMRRVPSWDRPELSNAVDELCIYYQPERVGMSFFSGLRPLWPSG